MRLLILLLAMCVAYPALAIETLKMHTRRTKFGTVYASRWTFVAINQSPTGPCFAHDNSIWWGLQKTGDKGTNGALRFTPSVRAEDAWTIYTSHDGLMDGPIQSILQSQTGDLFFVGGHRDTAAVTQFDGTQWIIHKDPTGQAGKTAGWSSLIDHQNTLWFTSDRTNVQATYADSTQGGHGIVRFDPQRSGEAAWTYFTVADGLVHNRTYDLAEGTDGSIWVATYNGISRYQPDVGWTTYTQQDGLGENKAYQLLIAQNGDVWCTHGNRNSGGVSVFNGHTWRHITQSDGMPMREVRAITQTQDGALWFGPSPDDISTGLIRYANNNWLRWTPADGFKHILNIAQSPDGSLWLGFNHLTVAQFQPDLSTLKHAQGILRHPNTNAPWPHMGVHVTNSEGQIRAGAQTDAKGRYTIPIFPEPHTIGANDDIQAQLELVGDWQGKLRGLHNAHTLTCNITQSPDGNLVATLTYGVDQTSIERIVREQAQVHIITETGRFVGALNDSGNVLSGLWREGLLLWPVELRKQQTP